MILRHTSDNQLLCSVQIERLHLPNLALELILFSCQLLFDICDYSREDCINLLKNVRRAFFQDRESYLECQVLNGLTGQTFLQIRVHLLLPLIIIWRTLRRV